MIAFATPDVQEHALGINVGDSQAQPFAQTKTAGVNEDEADAMIKRLDLRQNPAHLGSREDDGQFELRIGANQLQFVRPNALEGFFPEEFDGADGLGTGLAGDLFVGLEVNAVLADLLGGNQLRGFTVELAELTEAGVVGRFGARTDGQEFEIIGEGF